MMNEPTSIFPFSSEASFNKEDALELVPLFNHITKKTKQEIHVINSRLSFTANESPEALKLRKAINITLSKWADKIRRLGGTPLSPYKIELSSDDGRFMWEYPQQDLSYFNH